MKTIVYINSLKNGSTGHIMDGLAVMARENGYIAYTVSDGHRFQHEYEMTDESHHIYVGSGIESTFHKRFGRITGKSGCYSKKGTANLVSKLEEIAPDIVHLNNLHESYVNYEILFDYLRKHEEIKIVWTLHDCWAFTGHCPHYQISGCLKWQQGCFDCPSYKEYPKSDIDDSKWQYEMKKRIFTSIQANRMRLVTPSKWMKEQVDKSFLSKYKCDVIYNGIDTKKFIRTGSDFRSQNQLEDKIVILGVASFWNEKKGLDIFNGLAERLDENYKIVLVGVDQETKKDIHPNIMSLSRTESILELAKLYSAADIFFNPTKEEALGLVNVEALACGTPVIVFESGGAPETVNESCGLVIKREYIDDINKIISLIEGFDYKNISNDVCRKQAEYFEKDIRFKEYMDFYNMV